MYYGNLFYQLFIAPTYLQLEIRPRIPTRRAMTQLWPTRAGMVISTMTGTQAEQFIVLLMEHGLHFLKHAKVGQYIYLHL